MTYGYETESMAVTSTALGIEIPRGLLDIIDAFAEVAPINAGVGMYYNDDPPGRRAAYWVSGTSLVTVVGGERVDDSGGRYIRAVGSVRSLSHVPVLVEAQAFLNYDKDWVVARTITVQFEDGDVVLPDLQSAVTPELDLAHLNRFVDAVLSAVVR